MSYTGVDSIIHGQTSNRVMTEYVVELIEPWVTEIWMMCWGYIKVKYDIPLISSEYDIPLISDHSPMLLHLKSASKSPNTLSGL